MPVMTSGSSMCFERSLQLTPDKISEFQTRYMHHLLLILVTLASATITQPRIPRQILITKFVKEVGATDPFAFLDVGRTRLKAWDILTRAQLLELDTTDRNWFYAKTGINVSAGVELFPGAFQGPTWAFFPYELESDQRLDWIVADTHHPERTGPYRRHNWVAVDGGNLIAFTVDGVFTGGEWQGLSYNKGDVMNSGYALMVPNVTMSQWKRDYELHKCRTQLQPAIGTPNMYGQDSTIFPKSCVGVSVHGTSTNIVTNIYTNISAASSSERKTQAWTWSW